jgi:DNA-binding NarL/FixJ family response regulator
MDLSMPVMNGIEAARLLKRSMPTVPVVIFSEYSDVFSENEASSAGGAALVSKRLGLPISGQGFLCYR